MNFLASVWLIFDELRKSGVNSFILEAFSITNQPYYCMSLVDLYHGFILENKALFFGWCLFGGPWIPRKDQQVASTFNIQ